MRTAGLRPVITVMTLGGQCGAVSRTLPRRGGRRGAQCVGSYETAPHVGSSVAAFGRALPAGSALDREGRERRALLLARLLGLEEARRYLLVGDVASTPPDICGET